MPRFLSLIVLLLPAIAQADFLFFKDKGVLQISSEPGGAKIYLNGKLEGNTPTQADLILTLEREAGDYTIEAVLDSDATQKSSQTVHLAKDAIQPVHLVLDVNIQTSAAKTSGSTSTQPLGNWKTVERYLVNGGLVKDPATGLIWMRCSYGQNWDGSDCQGDVAYVKWGQAMQISENFDYASYTDWRLPEKDELMSLRFCSSLKTKPTPLGETECEGDFAKPTIVTPAFPNTSESEYWSASPYPGNPSLVWSVDFSKGFVHWDYYEGSDGAVRLVRTGR